MCSGLLQPLPHVKRCLTRSLLPLVVAVLSGCASFAQVRSADVQPGTTIDLGMSVATPPGEAAAWFWNLDCGAVCDGMLFFPNFGVRLGLQPEGGTRPYELGFGVSGIMPYVDAYVQLADGPRPFGLGARVATMGAVSDLTLTGRYDLALRTGTRVLFNSSAYVLHGDSPNGQTPGNFYAFIQGVGLQPIPDVFLSLSLVAGHTDRRSYQTRTTGNTAFVVAGVSLPIFSTRGSRHPP